MFLIKLLELMRIQVIMDSNPNCNSKNSSNLCKNDSICLTLNLVHPPFIDRKITIHRVVKIGRPLSLISKRFPSYNVEKNWRRKGRKRGEYVFSLKDTLSILLYGTVQAERIHIDSSWQMDQAFGVISPIVQSTQVV